MGEAKKFRRSELYKKVWNTPIIKLAEQYGLSDVGLAKICKKHNIPRPPRGYWARKEAGYVVKQIPLPKGEDTVITIHESQYNRNIDKRKSSAPKIFQETIVVPDRLSSPHPLTKQSSDLLHNAKTGFDGLICPPQKGCLDITVSRDSLRRALRIMDTIIKELEKQGYEVFLSEGHTKAKVMGVSIHFRISEKLLKKKIEPEEHNLKGNYNFGFNRFDEKRVPSGALILTIHDVDGYYLHGCRQNWQDGKKANLENQLNKFLEGLIAIALAKLERDKKREEEERQKAERLKRLEHERRERMELRQRYLEEERRVNALIKTSEEWKKSKVLREFISEIQNVLKQDNQSLMFDRPPNEWIKWATEQADRLDPFVESPESILDIDCPEEEKESNHYYYR